MQQFANLINQYFIHVENISNVESEICCCFIKNISSSLDLMAATRLKKVGTGQQTAETETAPGTNWVNWEQVGAP